MHYVYKRAAQTIAIRNILISLTLFSLMFLMVFLYIAKDGFPLPMLLIGIFLGLLIGGIFLNQGLRLLKNKGVWEVLVNSNGIIWKSPDETVDGSFQCKLSEIRSTETVVEKWKTANNASFRYYLVLQSGDRRELPGHVGANLKKVIGALEQLGVENNYTVIPVGVRASIKQSR